MPERLNQHNISESEMSQKTEITVYPPTTFAELLHDPIDEPEGLGILHSPLTIASRHNGAAIEYLAFVEAPLSQGKLYDFLRRTSNDTENPGIYGVYADWRLPDDVSKSEGFGRLQSLHEQLGKSWTMFELHRKKFMRAIDNAIDVNWAPAETASDYVTEEQVKSNIARFLMQDHKQTVDLFFASEQFSRQQLLERLRMGRSSRKNTRKEKTMDVKSLKERVLGHIRNSYEYGRKFLETDFGQQQFDEYLASGFQPYDFPLENGKIATFFRKKERNETEPQPLQETVTKKFYDKPTEYAIAYKSGRLIYKRVDRDISLLPAIHWTTWTGPDGVKRTLHTGDVAEDELMEQVKQQTATKDLARRADSLVGLLAVAYLSPDVCQSWPAKMGLPGGKYEQKMGPAQIPVLAHIRRHELERFSPILPAIEKHAA